jgi:hypothetical protein
MTTRRFNFLMAGWVLVAALIAHAIATRPTAAASPLPGPDLRSWGQWKGAAPEPPSDGVWTRCYGRDRIYMSQWSNGRSLSVIPNGCAQ